MFMAISGIVFALGQKDSRQFRYQDLPCHLGILNDLKGNDVKISHAFFGSSKSFEAINSELIDESLARYESQSESAKTLDFSRSWRASGLSLVMMRDLMQVSQADSFYVEVNFTNKAVYHPYWYSVATYGDIYRDYGSRSDISSLKRVEILFKTLAKKVTHDLNGILTGRTKLNISKSKRAQYDCSSVNGRERPDHRSRAKSRNMKWKDPTFKWDHLSDFESRNDFYFQEIVDLASSNGKNLFFVYYYPSYGTVLEPFFVKRFESRYGVPLIHLNDTGILESVYETGYRDINHMNTTGQLQFAEWFAEKMRNFSQDDRK